jgi:hypothetical protein
MSWQRNAGDSLGSSDSRSPLARLGPCCVRAMARRRFGRAIAGAAGLVVSAGLGLPSVVEAQPGAPAGGDASAPLVGPAAPKPIPGGREVFGVFIHHYGPPDAGPDRLQQMGDQSQITDFDGVVTANRITGTGRGTDTRTGATREMPFRADMGFMQGAYVAEDGRRRLGTFGFT